MEQLPVTFQTAETLITHHVMVCFVNYAICLTQLTIILLSAVVKSLKIYIIHDSIDGPMAGQSYSLTCCPSDMKNLKFNLTYSWMKDSDTLNNSSSTLYFSSLSVNDSGVYTCALASIGMCTVEGIMAEKNVTVRPMPSMLTMMMPHAPTCINTVGICN